MRTQPNPNAAALKELQRIPGVGPSIAEDLWAIGIHRVADLRGKDPEALYQQLNTHLGTHVDRCMLYVFRCAVYYASNTVHDPALLQWWHWKDKA